MRWLEPNVRRNGSHGKLCDWGLEYDIKLRKRYNRIHVPAKYDYDIGLVTYDGKRREEALASGVECTGPNKQIFSALERAPLHQSAEQ